MSAPGESSVASPAFALRRVTQARGGRVVLRDVSLDLPRGAVTALVGPSGAGKTSLLRLLNRLDDPTSGEVRYDGRPVASYAVGGLRRRVGFVFQTPVMFPGTVADNLRAAESLGTRDTAPRDVPNTAAALVAAGLDDAYLARDAATLSGGERQRVSVARALMTAPDALLLDEPTAALDPEVAERLLATITRLAAERALTVVMVTHRLAEARAASTHAVMLDAGAVVEAGPTTRLFAAATSERARAYFAER